MKRRARTTKFDQMRFDSSARAGWAALFAVSFFAAAARADAPAAPAPTPAAIARLRLARGRAADVDASAYPIERMHRSARADHDAERLQCIDDVLTRAHVGARSAHQLLAAIEAATDAGDE